MDYSKVLVIDDEKDICFLLKGILVQLGYEVLTAHTLKRGLALFRGETPATVFLDINLPDGYGLTILPQFKDNGYNAEVVIISAYDQRREKNMAVKNGAYTFVSKPFTKQTICDVMNSLKERKQIS